jgi:hypothetical protein
METGLAFPEMGKENFSLLLRTVHSLKGDHSVTLDGDLQNARGEQYAAVRPQHLLQKLQPKSRCRPVIRDKLARSLDGAAAAEQVTNRA